MQVIRYVAKLNHFRHGHSISACAKHVNGSEAQPEFWKRVFAFDKP
jgi:hypothetical protein